jgi:hypothetical protein
MPGSSGCKSDPARSLAWAGGGGAAEPDVGTGRCRVPVTGKGGTTEKECSVSSLCSVYAPDPLSARELRLAALCVAMNTVVTIAGWLLWREGLIRVRFDLGWAATADALILLAAMDAAMYGLHRVAHHTLLFDWIHAIHHRTERRFLRVF